MEDAARQKAETVAYLEHEPTALSAGQGLFAAGAAEPVIKELHEAVRLDRDYLYSEVNGINSFCGPDAAAHAVFPDAAYSASNEDNSCNAAGSNSANTEITNDTSAPDIPLVVNKKVKSFISYFQNRGRRYFERWLGRSPAYMSMMRSILRENGMPEDLSYIALIESGLNPTAKSRAKAVGMWQFVRGTARKYGLRVDWWIDERMDPEKSTRAAAHYFKNLYDQFGSWYLAAAGYNAGEGRVLRAMRKHRTEDFWALASYRKPLKRETKEYVPKYLAAMLIAKDPKSYGFDEQIPTDGLNYDYDKVRVSQATDLKVIAEATGTTTEEIKRLNPELLRWFTPPDYPGYEVKIPSGTTRQFEENFSKIPAQKRVAFIQHKVARRETIAGIAKRYRVPAKEIVYLNGLKKSRRIKPGTVIFIPVRASDAGSKEVADAVSILEYQG